MLIAILYYHGDMSIIRHIDKLHEIKEYVVRRNDYDLRYMTIQNLESNEVYDIDNIAFEDFILGDGLLLMSDIQTIKNQTNFN
jgi:hypothetical protein